MRMSAKAWVLGGLVSGGGEQGAGEAWERPPLESGESAAGCTAAVSCEGKSDTTSSPSGLG